MALSPSNIRQLPPIHDGLTIVVQGTIFPHATRFAVNLCTGPNFLKCDTALHINTRYDQNNVVVRNAFLNGAWGEEERDGPPLNVGRGEFLECLIHVHKDVIKVAFNGHHYCKFAHRMPKERINHIVVSGDMQLENISFYGHHVVPPTGFYGGPGVPSGARDGGYGYPVTGESTAPEAYPTPIRPYIPPPSGPAITVPSEYPTPGGYGAPHPVSTPVKHFIPGGLFPGRLIYITATPGPTHFAVNLRTHDQDGDIAFQFNPRINNGVVVRNTRIAATWGAEEKAQPSFPFHAGEQFQMIILCGSNDFKVAVNNKHFIEYHARLQNPAAIEWIEVVDDATVSNIFVQ